jgi:virginiamycin B lyase
MPGANRFPWTAQPDKDGLFWTPEYGQANKISRLNAQTGEIKEFPAPNLGPALIHSAVPSPDGSVWLTEAGSKKLGHWDPNTQAIEEYQDSWRKHTIKIHPDGRIWSTGGLTVFDPKTKTYTHIADAPNTYGIDLDSKKNVWFTEMMKGGKVGVVDPVSLKVTKFTPPTDGRPRRIVVAPDDVVWFAEFDASKIGRVDPKSGTVQEFDLPLPHTKPYALKMTRDGKLWYSSESRDVIGRFDPASGKALEFPLPYSDNGMRDFFPDGQGRLWYASPPNNKVGYFYMAVSQ